MHVVRERVFVDSGPWIAFASARDGHHTEAALLFQRAVSTRVPLITTNLVVAAVQRLLLLRAGRAVAQVFLDRLDRSPALRLVFAKAEHHERARAWLDKLDDQVVSYTDAVSFAVVESERCSAVMTFDQDFTVAGFRRYAVTK